MTDDAAARLDALETRLAYQDETIEALNQTVTAQWATIERLSRQVAELAERFDDAGSVAPVDRPPPHY